MTGTTSTSEISSSQVDEEVNNGDSEHFSVIRPRQARTKKPRIMYRVRGDNGPDWDMPNNDIESVSHAVLERVFFVKDGRGGFRRAPKPWTHKSVLNEPDPIKSAQQKVQDRLSTFSRKMKAIADKHGKVSPLTDEEFVSYYGGAKRRCYEAAVESLRDENLKKRDCRVSVFTKDEYRKPGGAPRAIQPRSPRFNVKLGRYIKHVEHEIFHAIDEIFDPYGEHRTVAKGLNMVDRGNAIAKMWSEFSDPIAVGLDASRFDQHINRLLLGLEHSIYHMWSTGTGNGLPKLSTLLRSQLSNEGVYKGVDGVLRYLVDGCRMSGDMNTSLGNVIIMCSLMYAYFDHVGLRGRVRLLNDGDDCVIIMDRRNLSRFQNGLQDWFLEMGITMEYDGIYRSLEEIEFCQCRPVRFGEGWRLAPRPTKRLYSDLVSTKPLFSKRVYRKQVGAIAGCGLACSVGMPVFQEFYQWLGRGATPWIPKEGDHYYKYRQELVDGLSMKARAPTFDERISFYFAFDITPDEQVSLEQYYRNLPDPIHSKPIDNPVRLLDTIQYYVEPEQKPQRVVISRVSTP
jgi:hypothetical protein